MQREHNLTFPVSRQSFQVLEHFRASTKACDLIRGNCLGHRETFFGNPRAVIDSSQTPHHGILHSWNQSTTGGNPVRDSTGGPVAQSEEQIRGTNPLPSFARRPSTMNSFFPAEGPQNYMADQQRLHISELHFDKFRTPSTFSRWKIRFKNPSKFVFRFSLGGDVMDQRSGDGRVGG